MFSGSKKTKIRAQNIFSGTNKKVFWSKRKNPRGLKIFPRTKYIFGTNIYNYGILHHLAKHSDEEKKNAGDDFKLHLELWRIRVNMIAAVLIPFFFTGRRQVPRTSGCYKYYDYY